MGCVCVHAHVCACAHREVEGWAIIFHLCWKHAPPAATGWDNRQRHPGLNVSPYISKLNPQPEWQIKNKWLISLRWDGEGVGLTLTFCFLGVSSSSFSPSILREGEGEGRRAGCLMVQVGRKMWQWQLPHCWVCFVPCCAWVGSAQWKQSSDQKECAFFHSAQQSRVTLLWLVLCLSPGRALLIAILYSLAGWEEAAWLRVAFLLILFCSIPKQYVQNKMYLAQQLMYSGNRFKQFHFRKLAGLCVQ